MRIPLGSSDFLRGIAETPAIALKNRYFEQDPTNQEDQVALLARPGLRKWKTLATSPVRGMYSQPGAFAESLFVVSGPKLYEIEQDETVTDLGTVTGTAAVSMAATDTTNRLFIANGAGLQRYSVADGLDAVTVPDNDGIISVGYIAGYVICVVAQGEGKNGRFYWIEPGEETIDPLNFATAERSPDPVWNVVVRGDEFWLPGPASTEVWFPSGDGLAPFIRQQARVFDKGVWEGTVVQIKDWMLAVGIDGMPYKIGSEPMPIGTPGIVQRFREAINAQRAA